MKTSEHATDAPPEGISFVSVVNDPAEYEHNLGSSEIARSAHHEWILIHNEDNARSPNICELYCEAWEQASNDLVCFLHQDVFIPADWEMGFFSALADLEARDPRWGVLGAVGVVPYGTPGPRLRGHWADPHRPNPTLNGPLPFEVEALDELWLGLRKSRGVKFDPELPGFHCYGIDLSLTARSLGMRSYAIDAFVWHKYKDPAGRRIREKAASTKIVQRGTADFQRSMEESKAYVTDKWRALMPFQSTSMVWDEAAA